MIQRRISSRGDRNRALYGSRIGPSMLRSAVAELVGTFYSCSRDRRRRSEDPATLHGRAPGFYDSLAVVALAFELALAAIVAAIAGLLEAHVNPAVTLGLAVTITVTNKFP